MRFPDLPDEAEVASDDGDVIEFAAEGTPLPDLDEARVRAWLLDLAGAHGRALAHLTYVFCADDYLLALNRRHLDHDTLTDIITFDLADEDLDAPGEDQPAGAAPPPPLDGECYISTERTAENAAGFGESPARELLRVMAHGLLHLCGLGDKTPAEVRVMRAAEAHALDLYDGVLSRPPRPPSPRHP